MKRWFPWIVSAAIVACVILVFLYLKDLHPLGALAIKLPDGKAPELAIKLDNVTLVGWSGGKKAWSFGAKSVEVSDDRRLVTFDGPAHGSLSIDGKQAASISAKKIMYNMFTQDVYSPDDVEVRVLNGPSVKGKNIYWNYMKSKFVGRNGVDSVIAGCTVHSEYMEVDLHAKEVNMQKVSGGFKLE